MKKIIYLIRHSEQLKLKGIKNVKESTQIENEKIVLTINGEKMAEELSKMDELQDIDSLWSSNYVRAIATAKYIAERNNILINIDENFGERKLGDLKELLELGKTKKFSFTEEQLLDMQLKNKDGESCMEVVIRFMDSLNTILDSESERVAIVSHGAAIKFVLKQWCELDKDIKLQYDNENIELNSPGVVKLEFVDKKINSIKLLK
ncbi:MAG: histidine phosphatase family protein [Clostridia bacterium]|nr:histidine phosphatase family protein [Clostridia bacterium]